MPTLLVRHKREEQHRDKCLIMFLMSRYALLLYSRIDGVYDGLYNHSSRSVHPSELLFLFLHSRSRQKPKNVICIFAFCCYYCCYCSGDIDQVIERAFANSVEKIVITGTTLDDSRHALRLADKSANLYATVGCHPTRSDEFDRATGGPDEYCNALHHLIRENEAKVAAIGECGLGKKGEFLFSFSYTYIYIWQVL